MTAGHAPRDLYLPTGSPVHRMQPHVKLVAAVCFVLVVVATPRERVWAFGAYTGLLLAVALVARVPPATIARRMVVEVPFVLFAVALPFVAHGERTDFLGMSVSVSGLWGAWNVLAKATLGVVTSILLAATTGVRDVLMALDRLRMPSLLVQIMSFMIRYGDVVTAEMHRMRIARESRGFVARDLRQLPVVARSAGALFVRSYERGERVHLAMLSRGYAGRMPLAGAVTATPAQWAAGLTLPLAALAVALAAWGLR